MKYDKEVDVLMIEFNDIPVEESDEDKAGVILNYDKNGNIVFPEYRSTRCRRSAPSMGL